MPDGNPSITDPYIRDSIHIRRKVEYLDTRRRAKRAYRRTTEFSRGKGSEKGKRRSDRLERLARRRSRLGSRLDDIESRTRGRLMSHSRRSVRRGVNTYHELEREIAKELVKNRNISTRGLFRALRERDLRFPNDIARALIHVQRGARPFTFNLLLEETGRDLPGGVLQALISLFLRRSFWRRSSRGKSRRRRRREAERDAENATVQTRVTVRFSRLIVNYVATARYSYSLYGQKEGEGQVSASGRVILETFGFKPRRLRDQIAQNVRAQIVRRLGLFNASGTYIEGLDIDVELVRTNIVRLRAINARTGARRIVRS